MAGIKVHFDREELVDRLQQRLYSQLFGLVRDIGSYPAPPRGPRFFVDHVAVAGDPGGPPPATGAGALRSESRVRALGAAVERHADAVADRADRYADDGTGLVRADDLLGNADDPLADAGDLLAGADHLLGNADDLLAEDLLGDASQWVPAGTLLARYTPAPGEPQAPPPRAAATASHIVRDKAVLAALRRVVARDAAQGPHRRIVHGDRTRPLDRILARRLGRGTRAAFHLADSPGFTVTCVLTLPGGGQITGITNHAVLVRAMHEALLEAVRAGQDAYWRTGYVRVELDIAGTVEADGLGPDELTAARDGIASIVTAWRGSGRRVLHRDLTTPDVLAAGFHVARVGLLRS
ncbi:YcaO-like family protein [Actinomadura gamaensis]|uniref:YcaO-like family protein n=1 Tax=Actinomadura gamaensis TaxID=1763541 RepID=A0ABV9TXW0_9ACTN